MNPQVHKLYYLLILTQQNYKDCVDRKTVIKNAPGLKNRSQRERALYELNNLIVILDELPSRSVKIFEYVKYDNAKYFFKFTEDALPYYDKPYALMKLMGEVR